MWHNHFTPSLFAGIIIAVISFFYEATIPNIVLFSSVGASAIILTNTRSHHLTRLHTVILAYLVAIVLSVFVYYVNQIFEIPMPINLGLIVFLVGFGLFLINSSHPPAVSASLSFILSSKGVLDLIYLFLTVIVVLILVRLFIYTVSQNLSAREFSKEFKKSFESDR